VSLLRFLGLGPVSASSSNEPESLAELTRQLEGLPPAEARFVAAFAYLLARIAGADLRTHEVERHAIAERLAAFAGVDPDRAGLLAAAALRAAGDHGASDDHLVARAFRDISGAEERLRLIRCLYAVAAADEHVSTREDNEIFEVATAIGVPRQDVLALRSEHRERLGALRALPGER